jgi:hypothetical protein
MYRRRRMMNRAGNLSTMKKGKASYMDEDDDKMEAEEEFKKQQGELAFAKKGKAKKRMFQAN